MHRHHAAPREKIAAGFWVVMIALLGGLITTACSSNETPSPTSSAPTSTPAVSSTSATPGATNVTKETKNPLTDLAAAAAAGKPLYAATCAGCHGEKGKGDGPAAEALDPKPKDLTKGDVPSDPDGELFLVVKQGKMENGKMVMQPVKKLTDEQIWQVIAYVRTLAGK